MLIAGLQKMSLVDFPGKVACTVFTGGCDLRCPYCHNSELLDHPVPAMTVEEFFAFLGKRKGLLDGVCVTGGEPCIQRDLPDFLRQIREMGFLVKLDSNGSFPTVIRRVLEEGLADHVAIDVKNGPEMADRTTGIAGYNMKPLLETLRLLLKSGVSFETRTTVVEPLHTAGSVASMADMVLPLTKAARRRIPAWYLQPFTDRETVPFAGLGTPTEETLQAYAKILEPAADVVKIRGM